MFLFNFQVSKRLQQELMSLMMCSDKGISAFPDGDKLFEWIATVHGPADSVYEGLKYKLRLEFPAGYPYSAPTVRFVTPCFHPNVDQHGNICLDILKEKWSALYEVRTILLSIQSLLGKLLYYHTIRKVKFLSKNSILTKPQHFHEFFT